LQSLAEADKENILAIIQAKLDPEGGSAEGAPAKSAAESVSPGSARLCLATQAALVRQA